MKFRSLTEAIDTETPTGRAMWQMIGVLAELERNKGQLDAAIAEFKEALRLMAENDAAIPKWPIQ